MNPNAPTLFPLDIQPRIPADKSVFSGKTFVPEFDASRLIGQYKRVWDVMKDGRYRTLEEIQSEILVTTGFHDSITGISARTRDFRKPKFGSNWVHSRRRGDEKQGVWEYALEIK